MVVDEGGGRRLSVATPRGQADRSFAALGKVRHRWSVLDSHGATSDGKVRLNQCLEPRGSLPAAAAAAAAAAADGCRFLVVMLAPQRRGTLCQVRLDNA